MQLETMQLIWYAVFITTMFAYAALDGFDIGVGCLQLFGRTDSERRIFMNAIGPVWDSNSLWVVISSGALLAGFPVAFAALFSSLYMPVMLLVFGYILRGVALEFRSKLEEKKWRTVWDWVFSLASYLLAFGFGIALANLIHGFPINGDKELVKSSMNLFSPYALLLGVFTTFLFMLHGALYLLLKTEGSLHTHMRKITWRVFSLFTFFWIIVNIITPILEGQVTSCIQNNSCLYPLVFMGLGGVMALFSFLSKKKDGLAFLASCFVILSLVISYAIGTFPNIVRSSLKNGHNYTLYNSSSSELTMMILLGIAAVAVPLFFLYMSYTYRVFKGKVTIDSMSY